MNPGRCCLALGLILAALLSRGNAASGQPTQARAQAACAAPEYRQFDFWLGDWEVFEADGKTKAAHVRVDRILDGCVLWEQYEDPAGHKGQSFSIYDEPRKVWHQSWVTNRGQLLTIEGKLESGEMVLSSVFLSPDKQETRVRGVWKPEPEGVRETAVTSTDGGKTWKPWFDLLFRRRSESAATADDAKTVAALDTQYQAAVKSNDAAIMDRILADNFILVTGSGKRYDKAALLEQARSGETHYERQDETEQTVRVFGDTAVVTAKLWIKGSDKSRSFDYSLWFSDTYVRTPTGWRYVFGQASLPLPKS